MEGSTLFLPLGCREKSEIPANPASAGRVLILLIIVSMSSTLCEEAGDCVAFATSLLMRQLKGCRMYHAFDT